ncbi:MAG: hypothetical protein RR049_06055, partial [Angelakisella sp.]
MNFNMAEIELLRLAGWYKSLPQELGRYASRMLTPAGMKSLCDYRLLHITKNGENIRLTPSGWDILSLLGFSYPQDSNYISDPVKLCRRNEAAQIMFTFYRAGFDVFADATDCLLNPPMFLSAAAARRNEEYISSKVWAGCRLAGIAQISGTAFMLHYINENGLFFTTEMELFHKLVSTRCQQTACIYAAESYKTAAYWILHQPPPTDKKRNNGWTSFRDACKRTELPLH